MKLEDIGFYTLSDSRAKQTSSWSPLWRCELILTDKCNFHCSYCRGIRSNISGDIPLVLAKRIINQWLSQGLKNIRFSGGEPTLYSELPELVEMCKDKVDHIAISTNASASLDYYLELIARGINDISISLDGGCCSATNGYEKTSSKVISIIKALANKTYVTLGMVFTEETIDSCLEDVLFAGSLGVSDIRVIPSAQYNKALLQLAKLPDKFLEKYPILRYRVHHLRSDIPVRGLSVQDSKRCFLVLDDMVAVQDLHFPCIIYMREGGNAIGYFGEDTRQQRLAWSRKHSCLNDEICRRNCLDVCRDYNNKVRQGQAA